MLVDLATELWPPILSKDHSFDGRSFDDRPSVVEPSPAIRYTRGAAVLEELSTRVLLFNDMVHTFDEVIGQVCKAIGCARHKASAVAWEVHTRGHALVFEGEIYECLQVSSVLEEIALHTQVMT
ncbi:MAG TPA: ATP-dependent Clp protease adaptor ClpS [Candidatus Kapabacteria bacterium]|nr:ATP-dependent Clp protease adaptor ClpS [Candidatus Kapabacteria bacterium]